MIINKYVYLSKLNIGATKYDFEKNLLDKMEDQRFLTDLAPLLPYGVQYNINEAYDWFIREIKYSSSGHE